MSTATNVDAQRTPVRVPFSGEDPGRLVVRLGACRLSIISGDENPWVEGTYTDPSGEMPRAREVFVSGGGSGVVLDLDGELSRELYVRLSASLSGVELTVPKGRDATITTRMTLGGTDIGDGFVTRDGAIHTLREDDAQPPIRVDVDVALGGLTLRTR